MTKAQELARARLIAYAQQPDVYYPPTPEECHAAYELIQAMEKANAELLGEFRNIAGARPHTWEDPDDFQAWAQNRARHSLAKAKESTP